MKVFKGLTGFRHFGTSFSTLLIVAGFVCTLSSAIAEVKGPQSPDALEEELLRKEAAVIKQLSASATMDAEANDSRASISPDLQKTRSVAPAAAPVAEAPQADLSPIIAEKERQIENLSQEVSKLRNRLMLAETEVERLSSILDERNRRQSSSLAGSQPAANSLYRKAPVATNGAYRNSVPAPVTQEQQDMQVVTVRADKAYLRTGPGDENSPLMTISKGTRLAVETRSGDWFRVISPAGTRAWISSRVVVFGNVDPSKATRIGGVR